MKFCHLTWCMYKRSLSGFDIYFSALVEVTTQNQLIILRCTQNQMGAFLLLTIHLDDL